LQAAHLAGAGAQSCRSAVESTSLLAAGQLLRATGSRGLTPPAATSCASQPTLSDQKVTRVSAMYQFV
jgi:hypothetical protein